MSVKLVNRFFVAGLHVIIINISSAQVDGKKTQHQWVVMMSEETAAVQGKRILYVDDEQALTLLGEELLGDSGAHVVCAFSGTQALELFHQYSGQFDLVVTDESMPGMSGIELAQELFQVAPDLPVVLCSGHLLSMNDEGIAETNIKDVLAKTDIFFKLPQLIEEIFPTRN